MILDNLISIYKPVATTNDYNEAIDGLQLIVEVRSNLNHRGGREGFYAKQVVASTDKVFTIRYYPGIDEKCWIKHDGRDYNIKVIEPIGRRQWLSITAVFVDGAQVPAIIEENGN